MTTSAQTSTITKRKKKRDPDRVPFLMEEKMEWKDCTVKINGRKWNIVFREFGESDYGGTTDSTAKLIEIRIV